MAQGRCNRCYSVVTMADGKNEDGGTRFHNSVRTMIDAFMAIDDHYSGYDRAVRWRFQAEHNAQTNRVCYRGFVDFGCNVKPSTALHWLPKGSYVIPVSNTPDAMQHAADNCIKDDARCSDYEVLDMSAGPYSYGFGDAFDIDSRTDIEPSVSDVCNDIYAAIKQANKAGVSMTALHASILTHIKNMT